MLVKKSAARGPLLVKINIPPRLREEAAAFVDNCFRKVCRDLLRDWYGLCLTTR